MLSELKTIAAGNFEAVDASGLMVDGNSGRMRGASASPAPAPTTTTAAPAPAAPATPSTTARGSLAPIAPPAPAGGPGAPATTTTEAVVEDATTTTSMASTTTLPTELGGPAARSGTLDRPEREGGGDGGPAWVYLVLAAGVGAGVVARLVRRRRRAR